MSASVEGTACIETRLHEICEVVGQTEVYRYIVQPVMHGFNQRFSVAFMAEPIPQQDNDFAQEASKSVQAWPYLMFRHAIDDPGEHFLDGLAQSAQSRRDGYP
jgi:hypothetical protein